MYQKPCIEIHARRCDLSRSLCLIVAAQYCVAHNAAVLPDLPGSVLPAMLSSTVPKPPFPSRMLPHILIPPQPTFPRISSPSNLSPLPSTHLTSPQPSSPIPPTPPKPPQPSPSPFPPFLPPLYPLLQLHTSPPTPEHTPALPRTLPSPSVPQADPGCRSAPRRSGRGG